MLKSSFRVNGIESIVVFVPELTERKLTVGKIYAGLLIAENWKSYKATGKTGGRTAVDLYAIRILRFAKKLFRS